MKKLAYGIGGAAVVAAAFVIRASVVSPPVEDHDHHAAETATPIASAPAAAADPAAAAPGSVDPAELPTITVYKSPTCGCCAKWVDHVEEHGFKVVVHDTNELTRVKAMAGVPARLSSCHTAIVDGYVIEGHVPADLIRRLLEERPEVVGLAVPGMPMGSPGMEGPYKDAYDVLAFRRDGTTEVYASR